jgi:hypothetical protein
MRRFKQQINLNSSNQSGFATIEMIVVLILVVSALGFASQAMFDHADNMAGRTAADHQIIISDAATAYIKDNYSAILGVATPTTPATITVAMLKNTGYLQPSVTEINNFGQSYSVLAIKPTPSKLQTLIITTGGETISETSIRRISKQVGARGGYISNVDTSVVEGSYAGWSVPLASYGVVPGAGHLATALFFDDGALTNDYLYRNAVSGHPEVNEMNTSINMKGNNLNAAGDVNATNVNATNINATTATITGKVQAGTTNTTGETYTGGWFRTRGDSGWYNEKWAGGWYMTDPSWVRSYGDKNVYTGGEMRAGKLTSSGRTEVGEYLQLDGIAGEGSGCTPNGIVGRDTAGKTLSCQSGVWKSTGGVSPSLPVLLVQYADGQSHNYCQTVLRSAQITASGPGEIALSIDGILTGSAIGYSGQNIDVAIDTSISAIVPAGHSFCFTSSVRNPAYAYTLGMKVLATYLD